MVSSMVSSMSNDTTRLSLEMIVYGPQVCHAEWPKEWDATDISSTELIPVVVLITIWDKYCLGKHFGV